jgi:Xaa-Pro aminopeptidase
MNSYHERRNQLLQQMPVNSVVIIPAARESIRNGDVYYPFRQDSDFYYLTGLTEPNTVLVLRKLSDKAEYILFVMPRDPEKEVWTGTRIGTEGACAVFGADIAYISDEFKNKLPELLREQEVLYFPIGRYNWFDHLLMTELATLRNMRGVNVPKSMEDISVTLGEMRLIKSAEEIKQMQTAADISIMAHLRGIKACKPEMPEYSLAAEYLYVFAKEGSDGPAYSPIVAGGKNACILHYTENCEMLRAGELVLVDAAAEYAGYAADITRTFPVNGRFSGEQRAIYEIVLNAQLAAINELKPGVNSRHSQTIVTRIITQGLVDLGLLNGDIDNLLEKRAYLPFYMHGCSHWLGLDTHDAGSYKQKGEWRNLTPNMVLTVEPGIYIRPESGVDERWHNIGVRIEDDVLITEKGCQVLTQALPKTIEEIENLMQ